MRHERFVWSRFLSFVSFGFLAACGGGVPGIETAAVELPSEISAVAPKSDGGGSPLTLDSQGLILLSSALSEAGTIVSAVSVPAISDYYETPVKNSVDVSALKEFEIINKIFNAISKTCYETYINQGTYEALIPWIDQGEGGVDVVQMQKWIIDAVSNEDGSNTMQVWIDEVQNGQVQLIRVRFDVTQPPTPDPSGDGSLVDLGVWECNAVFGDQSQGDNHFWARARVIEDGSSELIIQDQFVNEFNNQSYAGSVRAILYRSQDEGYGQIEVPDWDACASNPANCPPQPLETQFAYNDTVLVVMNPTVGTLYLDRDSSHPIDLRYKLFDATTGQDVEKVFSFGFPVTLANNQFGWYGNNQSRHNLYLGGQGGGIADGTQVTKADVSPGQTPPTYTTKSFSGTLTKRTKVAGAIAQISDVPMEIWMFKNHVLEWVAAQSKWYEVINGVPTNDFTSLLGTLQYNGPNDKTNIFINGCFGGPCDNFVYLSSGPSGAGFYYAAMNQQTNQWQSNGTKLNPNDGDQLFANVGGQKYVAYTAQFAGPTTTTGWVEKTLTGFNQQTWTPTFDDNADLAFAFNLDDEYFINNKGQNYIVRRTATNGNAADFTLWMEVQTVVRPDNFASLALGITFVEPWDPSGSSTYVLETNPASPNYLLLKYATVNSADQNNGVAVGDVLEKDIWGLRDQANSTKEFNWEHQGQNEYWGGLTYLLDSNANYVYLSNPLQFNAIQLANEGGTTVTLSLMFDGHMQGLPDVYGWLGNQNFQAQSGDAVFDKNVRIPDGTELTESTTSNRYITKAVEIAQILEKFGSAPAGAPALTEADAIDLDAGIPIFVPNTVSTAKPTAVLKCKDGIPVQ